jgi:hypothetical protein
MFVTRGRDSRYGTRGMGLAVWAESTAIGQCPDRVCDAVALIGDIPSNGSPLARVSRRVDVSQEDGPDSDRKCVLHGNDYACAGERPAVHDFFDATTAEFRPLVAL